MTDVVYIYLAQDATCSYKHTWMYKQMSDKHVYHTLRDTHTRILRQHVCSGELPAARNLWGNRTPPVLFIFPSRANTERPSNWSRLHLLSLIQTSIAACPFIFCLMGFVFPCIFFPFPEFFSLHLILKCKILCNYFKFCGRLGCVRYLKSQWWWDLIIQVLDWG